MDKSQRDREEDSANLQHSARFMYIAQSEFPVGKAALWKVMQGPIFHEWGQGASAEVMERNEVLLSEFANALCGGSEGFIDPANAMDAGEERHRAEAQRLTDSHSISTRLLKKQAVEFWKLAKFMSNFWPLVSVALGCFVYHSTACLHRSVQEKMFGALPAVSAVL